MSKDLVVTPADPGLISGTRNHDVTGRRFAWFDCLRCAAVFFVLLAHSGNYDAALPAIFRHPFDALQRLSWVGVDLFFVLSGFLVSGLLFEEHDRRGSLDIRRFLIRRAFKIIPAFYVLVLVTALHDWLAQGHVNVTHLLHDLFFLQSYRAGAWSHAWTLAIEVHFYLLLALLLYWLARRSSTQGRWLEKLPSILVGILLVSLVVRYINSSVRHGGFNLHRELEPTHLHLDVLAAGVLLRYLYNYRLQMLDFLRRFNLFWIALGVLLIMPAENTWRPTSAMDTATIPTCDYVGFCLILFQATQLRYPAAGWANWLLRPFDFLGKHSYSIYLWHLPVKEWLVNPLVKEAGALYFTFFVLASLAVGTLFSILLEMPILHLRNRLFPSSVSLRKSA